MSEIMSYENYKNSQRMNKWKEKIKPTSFRGQLRIWLEDAGSINALKIRIHAVSQVNKLHVRTL